MAERWVSVGRKHCDICKCWFADNKASIEFHERGERHRNALAQKLRDVGKQRELKLHAEINLQGQLAAMQAGAFLSAKKYGEERGADGDGEGSVTGVTGSKYFDPRVAGGDISTMAAEMAKLADQRKNGAYRRPDAPAGPVPIKINKEALEKAQKAQIREGQRRAAKQARLEAEAAKKKKLADATADLKKETKEWVEAQTAEGQTYYWHMYTGETIWTAPAEFFSPVEYEIYLASLEAEREIEHNFELAESEQRAVEGGEVDEEAQQAYEEYYGADDQLPQSSEYLLEIKQKRRGVKRVRDRRPKAQPEPLPGTVYAPGAIGFVKQAVSSRLNEVDDVNAIPLPGMEPAFQLPRDEMVKEEPAAAAVEEEAQVYNYAPAEPEPEKVVDMNTGMGGWTKVAKKEKVEDQFFSPLTARYRELEEQEKKEAAAAAAGGGSSAAVKLEEKEEKVEFTEKVAATLKVKGKVEFKKRAGGKNVRKREE